MTDDRFGPEVLSHVARLARISLSEEEAATLGADLSRIVAYIGVLEGVTADPRAEALSSAGAVALRDDVPQPCLPQEAFAHAAPEMDDGSFAVPAFRSGA